MSLQCKKRASGKTSLSRMPRRGAFFCTSAGFGALALFSDAFFRVVFFFVASSDSGSMVIDIITAGGNPDPPKPQRLFWAILEGTVAAILLLGGGMVALQTAAISTGLPFAVVMFLMCFAVIKGLLDHVKEHGYD